MDRASMRTKSLPTPCIFVNATLPSTIEFCSRRLANDSADAAEYTSCEGRGDMFNLLFGRYVVKWLEKLGDAQRQPQRDADSLLEESPPHVTVTLSERAAITGVNDSSPQRIESDGLA